MKWTKGITFEIPDKSTQTMIDNMENITESPSPHVELNHLIVLAKDKHKTANFITNILDLPAAIPADGPIPGFFFCIELHNNVMMLIAETKEHPIGHYAFKVTNSHFEKILDRIQKDKLKYWADPGMQRPYEYYEQEGNKGFYLIDPSGHALEILTTLNDKKLSV